MTTDNGQRTGRGLRFTAAAVALCGISALAATRLSSVLRPAAPQEQARDKQLIVPPRLFHGWPKPDVALLLSGEQHGYLLPCGCSRPQVGGLERRYNLLQLLRQRGWPVAAVDLGDVAQRAGPRKLPNVQGLLKYRYAMECLDLMKYLAVGVGEYESALSLTTVLDEYALNNPNPRVLAANLLDKDTQFPNEVFSTRVQKVGGLTVGVAGLVGPSVQKKIQDPKVQFAKDNRAVVPQLLADLKAADLRVLLYQGSLQEATTLAGVRKEYHVILCRSPEDEPRSDPVVVGNTLVIGTGHKGRYVGVVGVYRTGKANRPFEMRYELVSLGEEFMTPKRQLDRHPIVAKMEEYTQQLRKPRDGSPPYLARYGQRKHDNQVAVPGVVPTYAGTDTCKKCHKSAYDVWARSKHSHAYEALVQAKRPSLRQFDGECIVCHTVGFGYESGFKNEAETPRLKNVGCESCHGPASEHVKQPNDAKWHPLLNPWKARDDEKPEEKRLRQLRIDKFCSECHDIDNDVHFKFEKRWPEVAH